MKLEFFLYQLLLLVIYFNYVKLVPNDYCLPPLNRSDCGTPPTPVFSYYKYGSRCEIEYWRGCPTKNMFENEYHCSHYCIGKTRFYGRERGSWEGRDRTSNDDLTLSDLEEENGILRNINDSVTDVTDAPLEEIFTNHYPTPRVRDSTTTVEYAKKDDNDKTTIDNVENTEDNSPDDDEDAYVTSKVVTLTQMPITGEPTVQHVFV